MNLLINSLCRGGMQTFRSAEPLVVRPSRCWVLKYGCGCSAGPESRGCARLSAPQGGAGCPTSDRAPPESKGRRSYRRPPTTLRGTRPLRSLRDDAGRAGSDEERTLRLGVWTLLERWRREEVAPPEPNGECRAVRICHLLVRLRPPRCEVFPVCSVCRFSGSVQLYLNTFPRQQLIKPQEL